MKLKKIILFTIFFTFLFVLYACGNETEPSNDTDGQSEEGQDEPQSMNFRMYTNVPDQHLWTLTAEKFQEELEQRSDGLLDVEIYSNAQLGEVDEAIQMMNTDNLDFAFIPTAFLVSDFGELNAWFMPFLFSNLEDTINMRDSQSAQKLLDIFEERGLIGMDWLFTGNHDIIMIDTVLDTPDAFEGQRIRTAGSEPTADLFQSFGASAVSTPLSEVYTSLQTGVIDGTVGSSNSVEPARFHEVADEYTVLNLEAFNAAVLMSQQTDDKLSSEEQEIVNEAMKAAIDWGNDFAIEDTEEKLQILEDEGLNIHEVDNFDPFMNESENIYQNYSDQYPIIQEFIEEAQSQ